MKGCGCHAKKSRFQPISDKEPKKYFWVDTCPEHFRAEVELQQEMYNVSMTPSCPVPLSHKLWTNPQQIKAHAN